MQSNHQKRAALIARAEAVSLRTPYSQADSSLFTSLMRLSDAMLDESEPSTSDETRKASLRLRDAVLGTQYRTYSPMSDSGQPALIANDFSSKISQRIFSSGPLYFR